MENKTNKESKLVFNQGIARALVREGCTVVDLKPDRNNTDKTIVVFKNDDKFQEVFATINDEIAAKRAAEAGAEAE